MTSLLGIRPIAWLAAFGLLGPSCSSCIAEGTLVETPSGLVPIENLRIGSTVWSVDVNTRERVAARILAVRSAERECMALSLDATARLVCTPDHPIFAAERGDYVDASQFVEGQAREVLLASEGTIRPVVVAAHERYVGVRRVFDITVDSDHHNFIADGIVVHNKRYCETDACIGSSMGIEDSSMDGSGSSTGTEGSTGITGTDTSTGTDTGFTENDDSTGGTG